MPAGAPAGQTLHSIPSHTQDGIDDLDQYTQEIRFAQQATDAVFWQGGVYYFDSKFQVTTFPFFVPPTTVEHKNTAWAAFAHVSVDVTDAWNITGGVRYTDDDKDFTVISTPFPVAAPPRLRPGQQVQLGSERAVQGQRWLQCLWPRCRWFPGAHHPGT